MTGPAVVAARAMAMIADAAMIVAGVVAVVGAVPADPASAASTASGPCAKCSGGAHSQ